MFVLLARPTVPITGKFTGGKNIQIKEALAKLRH
jgi:hypothetical protein